MSPLSASFSALGLAFWFGVLTSISPCPMATNIAAVSYIGKRAGHPLHVLLSGLLYTLGRAAVYLILGVLIVSSVASARTLSQTLQTAMNQLLGPILILVGMFLLELLEINLKMILTWECGHLARSNRHNVQQCVEKLGLVGAFLLGVLFALSFCPVSAALFFGSLISLAMTYESRIALPLAFGAGTALPVLVFSILIAFGGGLVGRAYQCLTQIEWWTRRLTGVIFILVGIYHSLVYVFGIQLSTS